MITPKLKDEIINEILISFNESQTELIRIGYDLAKDKDISELEFRVIIKQLAQYGLLSNVRNLTGCTYDIRLEAKLFDFYNRGGFVVQEEILLANLEKLGYELDALSKEANPRLLDRISNIAKIAASIASAIRLIRV